jgi:hypothetical protein
MISLTKGVALLHFGRVGSTLIASMISQNKFFYDDGEIFEKLRTGSFSSNKAIKERPAKLLELRRRRFFYRPYLVSIKPIPEEHLRKDLLNMSYPEFLQVLENAKIDKIIILKRKNYLNHVLSGKLALEWKKYHFKADEKAPLIKIHLDFKSFRFGTFKGELLELFARFDQYYNTMETMTPNPLILTYEEDIEENPYVAYEKVRSYLKLNKKNPKIILSKSNVFKNEDVIENWEDLKNYLEDTPYKWMV